MKKKNKYTAKQLAFCLEPASPDLEKRLAVALATRVKIVYTDNTRVMLSSRRSPDGIMVVRLHHMFRGVNDKIASALAAYLKNRDRESGEIISEFIKTNSELVKKKIRPSIPAIETRGEHHDLARYFMQLNKSYFDCKLNTWITWGQRTRKKGRNHIRLGSYNFEQRVIRIHPALDKKWVPKYYIESVIYHEMLHAYFGVKNKNGKCQYHTKAFKEKEINFSHWVQAREWEKKNIKRIL